MDNVHLSVVVPAYNESKRIGPTLDAILFYLRDQPYRSEILVVDDGSTDDTAEIARQKLSGREHKILVSPVNRGKGHAVKRGMLEAKGEFVHFTDADLSVPIEELAKFLERMHDYDVVIGSRAHSDSDIAVRQNPLRENMGKTFNIIARMVAFRTVRDSQCGFKCFRREAARDLFMRQKLEGFGFDAEIVHLAQRLGYRVLEMPVTWRNSPQSRVRLLRDPFSMFWDLARIRWIHRRL